MFYKYNVLNNSTPYYQERLREELVKRIDKNPRYSLRAFAATLGIGPSALSLILAGKRSISTKLIERLFNALELNPIEQKKFIESVIAEKEQQGLQRISPVLKTKLSAVKNARAKPGSSELNNDEFRVLSDWYHFAIGELTMSKNFQSSPRWIARALHITEIEAKLAVERLLKLNFLIETDGKLEKTANQFETKDKSKSSVFHRRRQKQILEKSALSLEQDAIEIRNHSSITLCMDPARMVEAKEKIQKLMWELTEFLVDGKAEEVYELNLSLFPLSKTTGIKVS